MNVRGIEIKKACLFFLYVSIMFAPLRCYGFVVGGVNFSIFRIAGLIMIFLYFLSYRTVNFNSFTSIIALLFIITVLQSSYSPSISGSRSSFISQAYGYIWIFFACQIISRTEDFEVVNKVILYSSIFPLTLGLYQWIMFKSSGRVPDLPFGFMVSSQGKLGLTYNVFIRITSCFGDPAYMTTFFVGVFSIAFQSILSGSNNGKRRLIRFLSFWIIVLIVIETIMSISVSGMVGLVVSLLLLILYNIDKMKKFKKLFFVLLLLGIGFAIYFMSSGSELIDIVRFKVSNTSQTYTNMYGRSNYIKNGLNVWLTHPIIGGGFGSLSINGSFSSAHSSLLTVLGQQGIVIFFLNVLILMFYPINIQKKLKSMGKQNTLNYFYGSFIGLISVLVLTLGYDTLYSLDFCYVLIALVNSYGIVLQRNLYDQKEIVPVSIVK